MGTMGDTQDDTMMSICESPLSILYPLSPIYLINSLYHFNNVYISISAGAQLWLYGGIMKCNACNPDMTVSVDANTAMNS